ncbi:hypothetical protein C8F01DRAFT_1365341 [Mycena amicta]|nr:hypothetical protein C8F01DRAFT_1365341 [Mycena amicta]
MKMNASLSANELPAVYPKTSRILEHPDWIGKRWPRQLLRCLLHVYLHKVVGQDEGKISAVLIYMSRRRTASKLWQPGMDKRPWAPALGLACAFMLGEYYVSSAAISTLERRCNPPPPPGPSQEPVRVRRTHRTIGLSDRQKRERNTLIRGRNEVWAEKRLEQALDPQANADASDDESLIIVAEEVPSPSTVLVKTIQSLSPTSGAAFVKDYMSTNAKRSAEGQSGKEPKKPRPMVDLVAGLAFPVIFNKCLRELHRYNIYIPICFFTDKNLCLINAQVATLALITLFVTDTNTLLIKLGITEETMTRDQWNEACINMVEFYREVAGLKLPEHVRMRQHFGYLNQVENSETIFSAI